MPPARRFVPNASSAGPGGAVSGSRRRAPFSSIRQYLGTERWRRRVPFASDKRGAMRPGASVHWARFRPALGGAPNWIPSLYAASDTSTTIPAGHERSSWGGWVRRDARVGYGGPELTTDRGGTGMNWRSPGAGKGLLSPGMKRSRDMAEFDLHERERSIDGAKGLRPRRGCGTPAVPAVRRRRPRRLRRVKRTGCVRRHHRYCSTDSSNARPSRGTETWFRCGRRDRISGSQTAESVV